MVPTIKKIADLGYLDLTPQNFEGKTYADLARTILKDSSATSLKEKVAQHLNLDVNDYRISNMEWLGLFSEQQVPSTVTTLLDALCHVCVEKMQYKAGERDMIVMRHEITFDFADRREYWNCTLVDYGIKNGDSSMSRNVSLPVAIAIRLVLEEKIKLTGIQIPIIPELYEPILAELETLGIKFEEKLVKTEKK